jgi:hypothetical protein
MKRPWAVMIVVVGACGGGGGGAKKPADVPEAAVDEQPPAGGRVMAGTPDQPHVQATITEIRPNSIGTIVEISAGSNQGVAQGWTGKILDPGDRPLGDLQILLVTDTSSTGRTMLSVDEVPPDAQVLLSPP